MKLLIKYKHLYFLSLFFIVLFSCSDDDNQSVFDQSPSERVAERITELQNLLLSQPNGFRAVYFPKDDERGGFTIFMQFNADGTVRQTSDFDDDSSLQNSSYDVRLGTTTELVFTTRNHITKATDPTAVTEVINGFPTGLGFFGTSVFQYFSNDNGVITFRDIRNSETGLMVLYPTNFTDFDTESVASVEATYASRQAFNGVDCATASVYDSLVLEVPDGDGTKDYFLDFNLNTIFFEGETINTEEVPAPIDFGAVFTLVDGQQVISISPALEVGGNSFEDFIFDSGSAQYLATVNGATATISQKALSEPTGEDILDLPSTIYFYDTADGTNTLLSPCFQELVIGQINANLDNRFGPGVFSFAFYALFLDFDGNCSNLAIWVQNTAGSTFRANYCVVADIQDNTLFTEYLGPFSGPNDAFLEAELTPMIDFFSGPQGLLYTNEGTFDGSINSYSNAAGAFTSLDNKSLRAYGLFF